MQKSRWRFPTPWVLAAITPALPLERCDPMDEKEIRKYAELMKELDLTGLEITEGDRVVRLERTAPQAAREIVAINPLGALRSDNYDGRKRERGSPA